MLAFSYPRRRAQACFQLFCSRPGCSGMFSAILLFVSWKQLVESHDKTCCGRMSSLLIMSINYYICCWRVLLFVDCERWSLMACISVFSWVVFTRRIFLAGWCAMYCWLLFHLRLLTCMCLVRWLLWQWTDLPMDWVAYVVRQSFVSFLALSLRLVVIEDGYSCCSAVLNLVGIWLIGG